jgi:TPR repeat protein
VLGRLDRVAEALQAAGMARAMARTPSERDQAQRLLAELAKARLAAEASSRTANTEPAAVTLIDARATASAPAAAEALPPPEPERPAQSEQPATPEQPGAPGPPAAEPSTRPASGAARTDVSSLMNRCLSARETCAAALPAIVSDCEASRATSRSSCAFAGFALDVGLGVTADAARAAGYYRMACAGRDQRSCVRLASLQASGRGVPRDVAAALAVLEPACTGGSLEACPGLALALLNRGQPGDQDRARILLRDACDNGDQGSCALLKKLPVAK